MENGVRMQRKIGGHKVRCRELEGQEYLSLTDLHRAAGRPSSKHPSQWLRLPRTKDFLELQSLTLTVPPGDLVKARAGRYGATWAKPPIAMRYADYLKIKLRKEVLRAWSKLASEDLDPELAVDISFQRFKAHYMCHLGYSEADAEKLAAERLIGIAQRNLLTREWQRRGAKTRDYGPLTNACYQGMFDKNAAELRKEKGLLPRTNMRNHFPLDRLTLTRYCEERLCERLQMDDVYGADAMSKLCYDIGNQVSTGVAPIREAEKVTYHHPKPKRRKKR